MPAGSLDTVPEPVPFVETLSVSVGAGLLINSPSIPKLFAKVPTALQFPTEGRRPP